MSQYCLMSGVRESGLFVIGKVLTSGPKRCNKKPSNCLLLLRNCPINRDAGRFSEELIFSGFHHRVCGIESRRFGRLHK